MEQVIMLLWLSDFYIHFITSISFEFNILALMSGVYLKN